MNRKMKSGVVAVAAVAMLGAGGTAAVANNDDDDGREVAITGQALEQASDAALAYTDGGKVTDTEVDDEEGYYEVEVTKDDGSQVDVHLDRDFEVLGAEGDDDTREDDGDEEGNLDNAELAASSEREDDDAPGSDDDAGEADEQVSDADLRDAAGTAALEAAGGEGEVTEVEHADEGDEGYEVEVKLADGGFVEVALDDNLDVTSVEDDDD